jgi:hypothetical protein
MVSGPFSTVSPDLLARLSHEDPQGHAILDTVTIDVGTYKLLTGEHHDH